MNHLLTVILLFLPILLGAQEGLFNRLGRDEGMQTDRVYDLVRDRNNRLWFAGANGVYLLRDEGFKRIAPDDLFEAQILGLSLDAQNRLWCYTSEGKIYRLDNNRWRSFALNEELRQLLQGRIINAVQFDENGIAWIASALGGVLLAVDIQGVQINKVQLPSDTPYSHFIKHLDGNQFVWGAAKGVGQGDQVLMFYTTDKMLRINLSGKNAFGKSAFIPLSDGSFLFGLGNEIIQFNTDKILSRRFTDKPVECLYEDYEGKIWVGLNGGGLLLFPTGSISETGNIEYLGNKSVTAIHEDIGGRLWASTAEDGVYYYNQGKSIQYVQPSISQYLEDDNREVQAERIPNNNGRNGKSTASLTRDTVPPLINFTGFQINGRDTLLTEGAVLSPDKNFIKFYFVGNSPTNPGLFQYRYRLLGADKELIFSSSNFAQYTTLPPGKYRFEVSAMSKEGFWSAQPAVFTFEILPYFYQTTWFLLMCVFSGIALIIMVVWWWSVRYKNKQQRRTALDRHIASIELSALRAQMNPHFIFNTLSSIQYFVSSNNTEEALRYLSKFASLMRVILNNSRKKVIALKDELKAIELYLELEKLRFKQKFDFTISIDDQVDTSYDTLPSMLIQPFVENAILHGLMHKEGTGLIKVSVEKKDNHLECIVEDNGIGRKAAAAIKNKANNQHESQGMSITRDRLEIINRVNNSRLSAQIEDLKNLNGEDAGTRVRIFIPLEHE